jgi:hypothetical protein
LRVKRQRRSPYCTTVPKSVAENVRSSSSIFS